MKLVTLDFVGREHQFEKFRKDRRAILKDQLIVRCGRCDNDVATLLGLRAEIPAEHTVHRVHRLRSTAERENRGIGFRGIVSIREDYLVPYGCCSYLF